MTVHYVTFWDLEDLALGHEHNLSVDLARTRATFSRTLEEGGFDPDESAEVVLYAHDGNDYWIFGDEGAGYGLLALTTGKDGKGEFIEFDQAKYPTRAQAYARMIEIIEIDLTGDDKSVTVEIN